MKEKVCKIWRNFTILQEKIHSIRCETTVENGEFEIEFKKIRLKIEIEVKMGEKETTFDKFTQNFAILEEKVH